MPHENNELITKLGAIQHQIWQTVSLTVSETAGVAVNFNDPLTVSSAMNDLYSEMSLPKLIVQFAFASAPESNHLILLGQELVAELVVLMTGSAKENIDDSVISEVRPAIEGMVQGICLACGNIRNEAMVASGLSIRFQICSFPPNLQKHSDLVRVNVRVSAEDVSGSLVWLMDPESAYAMAGLQMKEEDNDFNAGAKGQGYTTGPSGPAIDLDDRGLEILMDIPLEISVELGRMRMAVKDVVELGSGSIVEIDKAAGEPVDVLVNGRLVARGEVVVIEDNFGVRITEILSPAERLAKLNEVA